jgi:hypothetical protein
MSRFWTDDETALLHRLVQQHGYQWESIAGHFPDRSPDACRKKAIRHELDDILEDEPFEGVEFIDFSKPDLNWRDRVRVSQQVQGLMLYDNPFTFIHKKAIGINKPIAIVVSSDWHLGHLGMNVDLWLEHIEWILKHPQVYLMVNGDMINNATNHRTMEATVREETLHGPQQRRIAAGVLKELMDNDKLLAVSFSEEHDLRPLRKTGDSAFLEAVTHLLETLEENAVPVFDNKGVLLLDLNGRIYVFYFEHKASGSSAINPLNATMKIARMKIPAHVIITAHTHKPAHAKVEFLPELRLVLEAAGSPCVLGGEIWLIQTGTYNTDAPTGWQFRNYPSPLGTPLQILILYPDRQRISYVEGIQEAEKLLRE